MARGEMSCSSRQPFTSFFKLPLRMNRQQGSAAVADRNGGTPDRSWNKHTPSAKTCAALPSYAFIDRSSGERYPSLPGLDLGSLGLELYKIFWDPSSQASILSDMPKSAILIDWSDLCRRTFSRLKSLWTTCVVCRKLNPWVI